MTDALICDVFGVLLRPDRHEDFEKYTDPLYPDSIPMLEYSQNKGLMTYVVSRTPHNSLERILELTGIIKHISGFAGFDTHMDKTKGIKKWSEGAPYERVFLLDDDPQYMSIFNSHRSLLQKKIAIGVIRPGSKYKPEDFQMEGAMDTIGELYKFRDILNKF